MNSLFKIASRLRSFKHAITGIWTLLHTQANARLHLLATTFVLAAGFYFDLPPIEWCLIVLSMMAVWTAEALNTALEFLADATQPEFHPLIKKAKDVAAAGVLISAIGAAIIATLIFGPRVYSLF